MCNLVFTSLVFEAFKNHSQVDVICSDLKKLFDSIDHEIVLIKLFRMSGLGELLVSWLFLCLNNRYFVVNVFGVSSNAFLSPSGVLPCGHLSPILFSLFINSASKALNHCKLFYFVDDMKLVM